MLESLTALVSASPWTYAVVLGLAAADALFPLFRGPKGRARRLWAERTLDRRGGYLIVVARFIPGGRTVTTLTAGVTRMRWPRFVGFAGLAAVLWASFAAGLGYLGGKAFEDDPLFGLGAAFAVVAAVTLAVELARRLPRTPAAC